MDIFLIVLGVAFLIASMALLLNPPEAWVKRAFHKGPGKTAAKQSAENQRTSIQEELQAPEENDEKP